jgi:hypothetical protein
MSLHSRNGFQLLLAVKKAYFWMNSMPMVPQRTLDMVTVPMLSN